METSEFVEIEKPKTLEVKVRDEDSWCYTTEGVFLNQDTIRKIVEDLNLSNCPVCTSELSSEDNFGYHLGRDFQKIEGYCYSCSYIIELTSHKWHDNRRGTNLFLKIYTNSRHSELVADSGVLAELKGHVDLRPYQFNNL